MITRLPCACRARTWRGRGIEHVDALAPARSAAKLRPGAPPNERTGSARRVGRLLERRHVAHGALRRAVRPIPRCVEEHGGRRHRLVGRRAEGQRLEPLHARLVVVGDQGQPLAHRLARPGGRS